MDENLVFLLSPPRAGSTLLARMLSAHPEVTVPPEPHLLTPLAHLGYYATVERAAYDPVITERAARSLVRSLPGGESTYLAALRAMTDSLYSKLLEGSRRGWLVDKTPAYALILDFVVRLYPRAQYLVLTRHPLAVWSSYVDSFFDGDCRAAHAHNPLLERYVPAIARFLREKPAPFLHLHYEKLVAAPRASLENLCRFLRLPFCESMLEYGRYASDRGEPERGLGDPIAVARHTRVSMESLSKWEEAFARDPARLEQARRILEQLLDPDLELWGYSRRELEAQLDRIQPRPRRSALPRTRYALERKLLIRLRRNIHKSTFGRWVRRVRTACDVLLR